MTDSRISGKILKRGAKMKRIVAVLIVFGLLAGGGYWLWQRSQTEGKPANTGNNTSSASSAFRELSQGEFRAVWLNFNEMGQMISGRTAAEYLEAVETLLDRCKAAGLNCVIAHVRSHSDSFYPSQIFPWSDKVAGSQGIGVEYDPLQLMIEQAHKRGMLLHAWLNPYRVSSSSSDPALLCEKNPARVYMTDDDKTNDDWAVAAAGGIYYNPGVPKVRELILSGVREILQNYEVDGIHFDDYFYPTADPSFDKTAYEAYQKSAGEHALPLEEWRLVQTNLLISGTYQAVRQLRPNAVFGVSPQASVQRNQTEYFADVKRWATEEGYVDYLCPQLYFGFEHQTQSVRFDALAKEWSELVTAPGVTLCVGLAPYKIGKEDGGSDEWVTGGNLLARQVALLRELGNVKGFALYNYQSYFDSGDAFRLERENLTNLLRGEPSASQAKASE